MLVIVGDAFDKGPDALDVIDLLRALEVDATRVGGHSIFTLGNHEAEFFADPSNDKATASEGVATEMRAESIDPIAIDCGMTPSVDDSHGKLLRVRADDRGREVIDSLDEGGVAREVWRDDGANIASSSP